MRTMGFEPILSAWKAKDLPLIYTRIKQTLNILFYLSEKSRIRTCVRIILIDLQSITFNHSVIFSNKFEKK